MIDRRRKSVNVKINKPSAYPDWKPLVAPETFVSPEQYEDFDLEINVYEIFNRIKKQYPNAKYIYSWAGATEGNNDSWQYTAASGVSIVWGERSADGEDVEIPFPIGVSHTVFSEGSTHRWVVYIQNSTSVNDVTINHKPVILYCGNDVDTINGVLNFNNSYYKFIFYNRYIKTIGVTCLYGCINMPRIVLSGVEKLSSMCFRNSKISEIVFGESLTTIENNVFQGDTALKSLILPDGVTTIGNNCFMSSGIKNLSIPRSVTKIGVGAFGWTPLSEVKCFLTSESISSSDVSSNSVFGSVNSSIPFHIPIGTLSAYKAKWPQFTNYIEDL